MIRYTIIISNHDNTHSSDTEALTEGGGGMNINSRHLELRPVHPKR